MILRRSGRGQARPIRRIVLSAVIHPRCGRIRFLRLIGAIRRHGCSETTRTDTLSLRLVLIRPHASLRVIHPHECSAATMTTSAGRSSAMTLHSAPRPSPRDRKASAIPCSATAVSEIRLSGAMIPAEWRPRPRPRQLLPEMTVAGVAAHRPMAMQPTRIPAMPRPRRAAPPGGNG